MTETQLTINKLARQRWSPRSFSPEAELNDEQVAALFESARWAPSSYNEQPWRYIYALRKDREAFDRILSCLNEKNQEWARDASMLVISLAQTQLARTGKENRYAIHDTGAANMALALEATHQGLQAHQMGGFSAEKAIATFDLPEGLVPVVAIAVGKLPQIDGSILQRPPKSRRTRSEFVRNAGG